jgi:glycosyltransferase involved in cell wall biosynthesis
MTEAAKDTRRMRVVIGCDTFPPDINGASRFAERLASGLVRAGHEVHVIAPSYSKRYGTFTEVHDSSTMTVHRVKSYRVVQHKTLRYVWPFTLKAKTDRILRELQPDAVHINSHMIVGRYLLRSAMQRGIRVIATNHIMPENLIKYSLVIPRWAEKVAMSLAWKDAGRILKKADVVTTPTRKAANLLESAAGLTGVLAVSCGIEASKFANNTPTTNTEPRVLYLGRLDSEKHIHNLIKAIALLPNSLKVKLEIVGDGGEREYLEQLAKDLCIDKNVDFRGHISDEELPKVYERATVFAMPSIAELQSIATMEAMASGRPVVAADAMALPHLVHDGDNGYLFPPDDVKALADRLLKVLTADQKELDRLSENSLHLIQSHDIETTIKIFEGLYRGDAEEPEESADNLATYSLPIGQLSKRLSRSIMLARKRSAELRARAEEAGAELRGRAQEARGEVIDRIEEVREDVVFAARRIEIRVRRGVKKAAERLLREEQ